MLKRLWLNIPTLFKNERFIIGAKVIGFLLCFVAVLQLSTRLLAWIDPYKPQTPVVSTTTVQKTSDDPAMTENWATCLKVIQADANNESKSLMFVVQNTCSETIDPFVAQFRLYDTTDDRIGWIVDDIGFLYAGEKVRWETPYPGKDYPLTDRGIAKGHPRSVLEKENKRMNSFCFGGAW